MHLNHFTFGGARQGHWLETIPPVIRPAIHIPGSQSKFSTAALLPPPSPTYKIHNTMGTTGIEHYRANEAVLREQSIIRAATSSFKIGKNEDGSVWMEDTSPEASIARMRASHPNPEIDWFKVNMDLSDRVGFRTGNLDEAAVRIDYYASEYAQYRMRIETQFSGDKQLAELEKLERLFEEKVGNEAKFFSEQVGGFLANNGVPGEEKALNDSYLDLYEQRKATYLRFIADNPDYASVQGTKDEWLLNSGEFMGEQLRYALISQQPEMQLESRHGYGVDDLQAIGTMAKELSKVYDSSASLNMSEEVLGIKLGLAAMKYSLISAQFKLSEEISSKMDQAFGNFLQNEMDRVTNYIDRQRADPFVRNKEAYAIDFDQKAVLDVVKRMVDNLKEDDLDSAFRSDWNTMVALYTSKSQNMQTNFLYRYHPYNNNPFTSTHNLAGDWNRFVQQLAGTTQKELDRYLLKDQFQWMNVQA